MLVRNVFKLNFNKNALYYLFRELFYNIDFKNRPTGYRLSTHFYYN